MIYRKYLPRRRCHSSTAYIGTIADSCCLSSCFRAHGCDLCGSCPIKPGNDVSTGMITANYVSSLLPHLCPSSSNKVTLRSQQRNILAPENAVPISHSLNVRGAIAMLSIRSAIIRAVRVRLPLPIRCLAHLWG